MLDMFLPLRSLMCFALSHEFPHEFLVLCTLSACNLTGSNLSGINIFNDNHIVKLITSTSCYSSINYIKSKVNWKLYSFRWLENFVEGLKCVLYRISPPSATVVVLIPETLEWIIFSPSSAIILNFHNSSLLSNERSDISFQVFLTIFDNVV